MLGLRVALAAAFVTAVALVSGPAQAASSGTSMTDPAGDIPAPSLDILSGVIRVDTVGAERALTMSVTMRGDLIGVPADYDLMTSVRKGSTCSWLMTRVRWNGAAVQQAYQQQESSPCQGDEVTVGTLARLAGKAVSYAVTGEPVKGSASRSTVAVQLPAPAWLSPGSVASFWVLTHTPVLAVSEYANGAEVRNYDLAGQGWNVR